MRGKLAETKQPGTRFASCAECSGVAPSDGFLARGLGAAGCVRRSSLAPRGPRCTRGPDVKRAVSEGTGPAALGSDAECQLAATQALAKAAICPAADQGKGAGFGRVRSGERGEEKNYKQKQSFGSRDCLEKFLK